MFLEDTIVSRMAKIHLEYYMIYPDLLRMVVYENFAQNVVYRFLSNDFMFETVTIAAFYRERWIIETFFKWFKQHLLIKTFYGTPQNAVFTQIWVDICDYLLLIIALKMYYIEQNLYIFSNFIGRIVFGRTPLNELFYKTIVIRIRKMTASFRFGNNPRTLVESTLLQNEHYETIILLDW